MKNLVFLTGAGISAESGIKTFRDADGLWEGHDIMEVASYDGFEKNPTLVLDFYNQRRKQLLEVQPNKAHEIITDLQQYFNVTVVTQNVDDLHERAGNKKIIHLHGELLKARSVVNENLIYDWKTDILEGTTNDKDQQLRPHIVWFGEAVPEIENAVKIIEKADIIVIVGTSLQVYPAAGLIDYADKAQHFFYVDLNPAETSYFRKKIKVIAKKASEGMIELLELLRKID
ncbi:MAG: Sir2 family NAD-dependent protein deacetylase [Flavobacterium sp.]